MNHVQPQSINKDAQKLCNLFKKWVGMASGLSTKHEPGLAMMVLFLRWCATTGPVVWFMWCWLVHGPLLANCIWGPQSATTGPHKFLYVRHFMCWAPVQHSWVLHTSCGSAMPTSFLKAHVCAGQGWLHMWFMNGKRMNKDRLVCAAVLQNSFM